MTKTQVKERLDNQTKIAREDLLKTIKAIAVDAPGKGEDILVFRLANELLRYCNCKAVAIDFVNGVFEIKDWREEESKSEPTHNSKV